MNYYNPYYAMYPYTNLAASAGTQAVSKGGILSGLFGKGITFSSILNGTQKFLNVTNQALPLIKQAGPVLKNAKTMFKVMNEFNRSDTPTTTTSNNDSTNQTHSTSLPKENVIENNYQTDNGPTFFA